MDLTGLLDRPIAFHRVFVTLTGSVAAALMLSQAIYWSLRTKDPNGWFYKTQEEWEEETGLTRREQETARKQLRGTGFWQEDRRDVPAKLFFRIDKTVLSRLLANLNGGKSQTSMAENANLESTKTPILAGGKRQSISEITTEITTKTTSESVRGGSNINGAVQAVVDPFDTTQDTRTHSTPTASNNLSPLANTGGRIPQNFSLTDELKTLITENCPGLDVNLEFKRFVAIARSKAMIALDWEQRFLAWCLDEIRKGYSRGKPIDTSPVTPPKPTRKPGELSVSEQIRLLQEDRKKHPEKYFLEESPFRQKNKE